MFITVYTYRARAGEEDAIIALHEDWARNHHPRGYVSGELLTSTHDPQAFVDITRYESEATAQAAAENPERLAWCRRLVSLTEAEPAFTAYHSTWRDA